MVHVKLLAILECLDVVENDEVVAVASRLFEQLGKIVRARLGWGVAGHGKAGCQRVVAPNRRVRRVTQYRHDASTP